MALNNFGLGFELAAKDSASAALINLGKQFGALEKQVGDANQRFEQMTNRTRDLTTGRFVKAPTGVLNPAFMSELGGKLKQVSIGMGLASAAITAGLGYASQKAADFEKAIALVATEADLSIFPQEKMSQLAMDLAKQYGSLPTQEAGALYKAVALGANTAAKAQSLLTGANLLAVAGNADLELTMNALGGALNAYGGDMTKATDFSDALFTAMKNGNTTVQDLAGSIGRITSTAAGLNVSIDEVLGAVSVMTNKGVQASEAVSGLKEALANVVHPSADAAKEAARLGIKFSQAELRSKGLQGFLKEITSSSKFTAESFSKLFTSVEGANAIMQVASGDMKSYNDVMDAMAHKTGATKKGFDIMSETSAFQQQRLKALGDTALIMIGKAIEPLRAKLTKFAAGAVEWFTKLSPSVIRLATYFATAAAAILSFLSGAIGAGIAIGGLIVAAKAIAVGLGIIVAGIAAFLVALVPLIAAAYVVYTIWTKNIGGLATSVVIWFDRIKLAFEAVAQAISTGGFSGAVMDELSKAENSGIKQFAINVFLWFSRIKNFFVGLSDSFSAGLGRVQPIIEKIVSAIQRLAARFGGTKEVASAAKEKFEAFGSAGAKVGDFLVTVVEKVATVWLGAINLIDGVVEVFNGFKPALLAAWDAAKALFGAIGDLFGSLSGGNKDAQSTADTWRTIGQILGWVANAGIMLVTTQLRVLGGILGWIGGLIGAVRALFGGMVNGIVLGVQFVGAILQGNWGAAWKIAQQMVESWAQAIINAFTKVIGGAVGMVDSLGKIFGKDLGLKAKVEGVGKSLIPASSTAPTPTSAPLPALAAPSPAVAQAQGQAVNTQAIAQAVAATPAPKQDINVKTQLVVDGQVLADTVQKHSTQQAGRGFAPTPAPT